ncbi:unnamed protein product [Musa textilis]
MHRNEEDTNKACRWVSGPIAEGFLISLRWSELERN